MVAEQDGEREGAVQARQHRGDRVLAAPAPCSSWSATRWATTSLSVSLCEDAALGLHLLAQRLEILDDAVVDDGDAADDVRMGVADGRRAVGRPAGVGDADRAGQRLGSSSRARLSSLPSARRRSSRPSTIVQMPAQS